MYYQGTDSDGIRHPYAIKLSSDQHFAVIHINRTFNFNSPRILHRALWLSFFTGQHIYVKGDNAAVQHQVDKLCDLADFINIKKPSSFR